MEEAAEDDNSEGCLAVAFGIANADTGVDVDCRRRD
jgi:hypothetical protein